MKILIVDDEELLVKGIKFNLQNDGYEVLAGYNGREAIEMAKNQDVSLIVLDVMMPEVDGLEACRKIREFSDVPIIMLTARTEDMDKLLGFEQGADDYLTKPFNILELKARIRALLRRSAPKATATRIAFGPLAIDTQERNAYKYEQLVDLTAKEFDVVELLMRNPNRVYSRENLLDAVWGYEAYRSDARTVDVHIRRIREKLEPKPAEPEFFMTKWGVGYYFKA